MKEMDTKLRNKTLRKNRIRSKVNGTAERPRLSVFISNSQVSAQVIDDTSGKTLVSSTTVQNNKATGSLTDKATWLGEDLGRKAIKAKITKVVFDRNGRKYHGRIKALADAARKQGLEF